MRYTRALSLSIIFFMLVASFLEAELFVRPARAFESSSAGFEMHAADIGTITGSSSSATFGVQHAGGNTGSGIIANVKKVFSSIMHWLFDWYVPRYDEIHYRWRNDDGSEVAATFSPYVEDGILTGLAKTTIKRLRFEISNEGWTRGSGPTFQLEVAQTATCSSGTYAAVPATATTEHWEMAETANLTDGAATTNVASGLTDANASFTAGETKDTGNQTTALTVTSEQFTEIEYSIRATTNAVSGATYCFRLTNAGSTTNFVYTRYARATIAGYPANGTLESSTFDTGITDGAAYNSILWTGFLNGGKVGLQLATSNCSNGATNYPTCSTGVWGATGSDYLGPDCTSGTYYEQSPGVPAEISLACATLQNKRYFRYKVRLCSTSDCSSSGTNTPEINGTQGGIIINWSP
ncbi:hypothetical protein HY839_00985 [Candidatus Azambacteria bacterium]|nr:hypothetical protein [Candidatus Azambacteria bacterium]